MYYSTISDKNKIERFDGGIHIPFQELDKLKVKRGSRSLVLEGFTGGLLTGIIAWKIAAPGDPDPLNPFDIAESGISILGYSLIGMTVGTLIGMSFSVERWKLVPLDKLKISLMPNGGGAVGLGLTLTF